jgi:hypothetical protein
MKIKKPQHMTKTSGELSTNNINAPSYDWKMKVSIDKYDIIMGWFYHYWHGFN